MNDQSFLKISMDTELVLQELLAAPAKRHTALVAELRETLEKDGWS